MDEREYRYRYRDDAADAQGHVKNGGTGVGHTAKTAKRGVRPFMPLWKALLCDFLALGIGLCTFAYFHHVRKSDLSADNPGVSLIDTASNKPSSSGSGGSDISGEDTDSGQFGAAFPDKFTSDGSVEKTDMSYKSGNINISVAETQENGITYFVADIYVKSIECLQTAFAGGSYAKGKADSVTDMLAENNGILGINGDYYGMSSTRGTVIRNGVFFRGNVWRDTCILYYDGTMETYSSSEFDIDAVKAKSPWQGWSFGPELLDKNGKSKTEFDTDVAKKNPRSAIGYYEPGHYCFVLVDGRQDGYSNGMTMTELSQLFEDLGCKRAYNMDGGQSSVMAYGEEFVNSPYKGGRNVSDIIFIAEPPKE